MNDEDEDDDICGAYRNWNVFCVVSNSIPFQFTFGGWPGMQLNDWIWVFGGLGWKRFNVMSARAVVDEETGEWNGVCDVRHKEKEETKRA